MLTIPDRVAQRAASNFVLDAATGCHVSTYSVASHGYAQIGWREPSFGKTVGTTAHRAAWVHFRGQISEGMTVDHVCKNRRCVNVEHMRLLSNFENARRTSGRDWPLGQCVNGHDNRHLQLVDGGRMKCGICHAEWQRAWRRKRREARTV